MVIKGKSRSNGGQLAAYLQRLGKNERIAILEHTSPRATLDESFRDWDVLAAVTQGQKSVYHAQINPDARYAMTEEQWLRAADVLEKELGLTGQPRAIVLHEKEDGRQHIHVAWQRCDIETMTFISDSWNYLAHEKASLALEREFGHELVPGKHAKRDRKQQPEFPRAETNHAEQQQAERARIDPHAFKEDITRIYHQCDSGQSLKTALAENGFILATGDKRGFVIVDEQGEVYSLSRQLLDVKAKDLKELLKDIDPLPNVEQAKTLQHELAKQAPTQAPPKEQPAAAKKPEPKPEPAKPSHEDLLKLETALKARHEEEGRKLQQRQEAERERVIDLADRDITEKLEDFDDLQQTRLTRYDRENAKPKGFIADVKARLNPAQEKARLAQKQQARQEFINRQEQERDAKLAQWNRVKDREIAATAERHAQQQREHADRYRAELQRYTQEQEAAQRLLVEIEKQRRQEELDRKRYGPEPPKRSL